MAPSASRLWHWRPTTSLIASLALLVALLAAAAIGELTIGWPRSQEQPWILAGIVLIAFVPVILAFVDVLAERGGKVETRWGSLEFAAAAVVHQPPRDAFRLPDNIEPAGTLHDTGSETLLAMLHDALTHDVVEVDLRTGEAWWLTRLFFVAAVAAERGQPRALVVLATEARQPRSFAGWAPPTDVRDAILRRHEGCRNAYAQALKPEPGETFEQQLGTQLGTLETSTPPTGVSLQDAQRLLGAVLWQEAVDRSSPPADQVASLLTSAAEYIAVMDHDAYVGLQKTDRTARRPLIELLREPGTSPGGTAETRVADPNA